MEKSLIFPDVHFAAEVLSESRKKLESMVSEEARNYMSNTFEITINSVESWSHTNESEFFADYRKPHKDSVYCLRTGNINLRVDWHQQYRETQVSITAPSREKIEALFNIYEANRSKCMLPPKPKEAPPRVIPRIFIGHGQNQQWRDMKDHLHEQHGYLVEAYEIGARAGHAIRDILEEMMDNSNFAVLVMTGEDQDKGGTLRARQNVVHELGLFQGRLGFSRAIVLLEEGTEEFSNIHGIIQIRYAKGNIKETYGEILATLKREFDK